MGGRFLLKSETGQRPTSLNNNNNNNNNNNKKKKKKKKKKMMMMMMMMITAGQPHEAPDVTGRMEIYVPRKANCDAHKTSS
jgi:hypothetical protein